MIMISKTTPSPLSKDIFRYHASYPFPPAHTHKHTFSPKIDNVMCAQSLLEIGLKGKIISAYYESFCYYEQTCGQGVYSHVSNFSSKNVK